MAIRNFLFYLIGASLIFSLTACETFRKWPERPQQTPQQPGVSQPEEIPVEKDVKVETPAFLQKAAPKLGLILGGGGALTYAHLGFLQELEKNKIKVHSIAGVEWGALIAGAYAMEAKAHATEWKLLKLPIEKFNASGFFSSSKKGVSIKAFNKFLSETFANKNLSDLPVSFTCSFVNIGKEKSGIRRSGRLRNAVRSCWPHPPHFKIETVGADLLGVAPLAKRLRAQGADIVVYVDVVAENDLYQKDQRVAEANHVLSWISQKSLQQLLISPMVDEVISVPVNGVHMTSYKSLRTIIRTGQVKSKSLVKGLAKKYAY